MSRAVVMRAHGAPEVLHVEEIEPTPLGAEEIRVRTACAAINHSDLEIRRGTWPILRTPAYPYVPGLEVVGTVVEVGGNVTEPRVGELVITMMQGLGGVRSERPGGYQEYVTVAASTVATVPPRISPETAAALGLAAVTAHQGLAPVTGGRVAVTGAAGGVGSAACALLVAREVRVTAIVRPGSEEYVRSLGVAEVITDVEALAPWSQDGVLDTVAGPLFEPLVRSLVDGGALSVVGAMAGDRVSLSAWELLRGVKLTGYSSESLDGPGLRRAMAELGNLVLGGQLTAPQWQKFPFERAAEAHARLEARGVKGRILLVP